MLKSGKDPNVKKTFVRDCEQKIKPSRVNVLRDTKSGFPIELKNKSSTQRDVELNQPTLCSSGVLSNYIQNVGSSTAALVSSTDITDLNSKDTLLNPNISVKITKKLNFHINDKLYKNLIELNEYEHQTLKKSKRPQSSTRVKKDIEPNLEDFSDDEPAEIDSPPKIPLHRPKFKPVKTVECGQMHRLVAAFEIL